MDELMSGYLEPSVGMISLLTTPRPAGAMGSFFSQGYMDDYGGFE